MTKWNKKMLTYIAFVTVMLIVLGNNMSMAHDQVDLVRIIDVLAKDENLNIEDWSVFAREINTEITTKEEFKRRISSLKKAYPEFHWSIVWDDFVWKAEASLPHVKDHATEYIRMITTEEHNRKFTYIIYEIKGTKWQEKTSFFLATTFKSRTNGIFKEEPSVFSCIKGSISDNMNSVLTIEMNRLLKMFNATEVEGVQEKNFSSISAHSPLFTQTLTNKEINMQLGLRRDGLDQKTNFVIGTPIITFEY